MIYRKTFKQQLPLTIDQTWTFFSNPQNLSIITPKEMNFQIRSGIDSQQTYPGQMITYSVSPILNITMTWVTEISQVQSPDFFVDEQRKGPYSLWHHQHHFKSTEDGTEMTDILHYEIPGGLFGRILNHLFVNRKIDSIFNYRTNKLKRMFPSV